jgi:enoyl-CoA hydratase/carnithine racemase
MASARIGKLVRMTVADGVARITLDRPERHNSLVPALLEDLARHLDTLRDDDAIRAVVLAASGRSFSTGGDVRAFHEQAAETLHDYAAGLVTEVVDAERLDARIAAWLATTERHVVSGARAAKRSLLPKERRDAYAAGLEAERQGFLAVVTQRETRQGMARFLGLEVGG